MSVTLTADMRAVIEAAHLCFAGTVSPDGKPNVSPKGTIRVWDDQHLFFLDIASPGTRANLQARPWMELNVVEQLSRRGYRFFGPVTLHLGDAVFEEGIRRVQRGEIVITRHGKPAGVLIGFESEEDWLDYRLEHDPEFLQRIAEARAALRRGEGVKLEDLSA